MDQESRRDYAQGSGNTEAGPNWDEAVCGEIIPRLERVLRASNDGYWEWNRGAQFVWVSRRWSEIAGIPAGGEFVTLAEAKAAIHPDDLADLVQKTTGIVQDARHGDSCHLEHRYLQPGGREIWVDTRASVTARDANGRATQVTGVVTDISVRKQAEDVLRRFELISENTRDIILFMRRDDGRILGANAAAAEAYGYSREELLAMSIRDLRAAQTHDRIDHEMAKADRETILFETVHIRMGGSTFPAEVSSRGATIGGVRTLISIVRDITERVRAQEAMASAALFPIENPSPVLRINREGVVVYANPASRPVLDHWGITLGETAPAGVREAVESALAVGARPELELTCGGREFSLLAAPIPATGYVNLYGYDVTERKRASQTLSEAKARQELLAHVVSRLLESEDPRTVVQNLAREVMRQLQCDAFFNYLLDDESGRLRLNSCAGVDTESARSIEWLDFGSHVCGCAARDQARIVAENIAENPDPRTRLVASLGIQAYACHPLIASGRLIGTLSFGSRTKRRFSDEDLELMRVVTSHIAIAVERLRSRNLLAESERQYRAIARSIPQGAVWVVDQELRYRMVEGSLAAQLSVDGERLEGRTVREATPHKFEDMVEQRFRKALAGESASYETEAEGRKLWSHYVPLRDEDGRIRHAMALALDITERKRIEARLLESQKMESIAVLAGGIAHDFNNLLVGIIGNVSLALEIALSSGPLTPLLEEALRAGEQAAHLTREMLAYSGRGRFVVESVNLSSVVRGITSLVRSSIPNQVSLDLDLDPELPPIFADSTQIQQIVMNLVINAGEAIGNQRGEIRVRARAALLDERAVRNEWADCDLPAGPYICLEVADTGCGMNAATRGRIFDPFFTTKFTGRGLGLAAVLGIVRGHNGGIRVESEPGNGTTFTLVFPAASGTARNTRERGLSNPEDRSGGGTILVVDDEQTVLNMAKAGLERRGYRVVTASSGPAAIGTLGENTPVDLVVLDLSMPGMNGQEVLPRLWALRPGLRIVVSSGYSESECREMFRKDRIAGFLQKPYTARQLADTVNMALAPGTNESA
jgi:PAS domain S-box-containing protein